MVTARGRLLLLLLALTTGSGVLAYARMAAWWVIVPPTIMLLGYLPLLRAAAKADAERRSAERARDRSARGAASRQTRPTAPVAESAVEAPVITMSASRAPQD